MEQQERDLLLRSVRGDLQENENSAALHRAAISRLEHEAEEMRRIVDYLTRHRNEATHLLVSPAPLESLGVGTLHASPESQITVAQIEDGAERAIRKAGPESPLRAIDMVWGEIYPAYDPGKDDRALENRVYTTMKRRPQKFVRVSRGRWTLIEFLATMPDLLPEPDEQEEPENGKVAQ